MSDCFLMTSQLLNWCFINISILSEIAVFFFGNMKPYQKEFQITKQMLTISIAICLFIDSIISAFLILNSMAETQFLKIKLKTSWNSKIYNLLAKKANFHIFLSGILSCDFFSPCFFFFFKLFLKIILFLRTNFHYENSTIFTIKLWFCQSHENGVFFCLSVF